MYDIEPPFADCGWHRRDTR